MLSEYTTFPAESPSARRHQVASTIGSAVPGPLTSTRSGRKAATGRMECHSASRVVHTELVKLCPTSLERGMTAME